MIEVLEKYDLKAMRRAIAEDIKHQRKDERQQKNISQAVISELMVENIKKKPKKHDRTHGQS